MKLWLAGLSLVVEGTAVTALFGAILLHSALSAHLP